VQAARCVSLCVLYAVQCVPGVHCTWEHCVTVQCSAWHCAVWEGGGLCPCCFQAVRTKCILGLVGVTIFWAGVGRVGIGSLFPITFSKEPMEGVYTELQFRILAFCGQYCTTLSVLVGTVVW